MVWRALLQCFTPTRTSCKSLKFMNTSILLSYIKFHILLSQSLYLVPPTVSTLSFQNDYILILLKMPIMPVTSATMRSKWPYGFNARMQCSCTVLTLIGCQNDLSQPQCPVTQIPTAEMTWIQTQMPRLKSCNLSHAMLPLQT
jgi:hypothetical protein